MLQVAGAFEQPSALQQHAGRARPPTSANVALLIRVWSKSSTRHSLPCLEAGDRGGEETLQASMGWGTHERDRKKRLAQSFEWDSCQKP